MSLVLITDLYKLYNLLKISLITYTLNVRTKAWQGHAMSRDHVYIQGLRGSKCTSLV
jgi:hypothetical protein